MVTGKERMSLEDSVKTKLLGYGVSLELALSAEQKGLTLQIIRSGRVQSLLKAYDLSKEEVGELKSCIKRKPISEEIIELLLRRSNFLCCICKGDKGKSYIIHHIVPYAMTQDNSYQNLVVLCPNDHDLAHGAGLTMKITEKHLRKSKSEWETQVQEANARRAAQRIDVHDHTVDFINIRRLEQLSMTVLGEIPETKYTRSLQNARILNAQGSFDQRYVRENLSGSNYLFDYITHSEPEHYKEVLERIASRIEFVDFETESKGGFNRLRDTIGKVAFFIGGVTSKSVLMPISESASAVPVTYRRKDLVIEWLLDPNYLISCSAILRLGRKYRFIIYFRVMDVEPKEDGGSRVQGSPLLIAQPSCYVDKTPSIRYVKSQSVDNWWPT
ncbi:HNH endonuclease [Pseudomonas capsici]|uniref:HNH endonuclease signature motif containing protein n=1 Tax=Pseudomonas capsici TaxID=2810614 RepID=UPI0021F1D045|nr:HNH endonuclease [Pseudomonas capsici]MCV4286483.1 HNH endonuclease [Pseudomonas capsici]